METTVYTELQAIGNTETPITTTISPTSPIMQDIGVTYFRASLSVIPLILAIPQKPLSFIQAIGFDPQPIANAR